MTDKLNMSLDDIIKMKKTEKKIKLENGRTNKNGGNKKKGNNRAFAGAGRNVRVAAGGRPVRAGRNIKAGVRGRVGVLKSVTANVGVNQATKKLVQKLVKKALRKQPIVAARNTVVRRRGGVAPSSVINTRRAGRAQIGRVLPQSRTIVRRPPPARAVQTVVQRVQPRTRVIREIITAPVASTQPVRVVRRPQRNVVVQRVAAQPRRQYVQQPARQIVRQVARRAPRVVQQQVQRVRPQQRQQLVRARRSPQNQQFQQQRQVVRRNDRFRNSNAGGRNGRRDFGRRTTVVQQVERYEPVQYVTERVVQRRGRGFSY